MGHSYAVPYRIWQWADIYGDDLPVPSIAKKTQVSLSMQLLFLINI
jgi:hypothetical protein